MSSLGLDALKSALKSYCTILIVKGPIMKTKVNHAMINETTNPHPRYLKYNPTALGAAQILLIAKTIAVTIAVISNANQNTSHSAK